MCGIAKPQLDSPSPVPVLGLLDLLDLLDFLNFLDFSDLHYLLDLLDYQCDLPNNLDLISNSYLPSPTHLYLLITISLPTLTYTNNLNYQSMQNFTSSSIYVICKC